MMILGAIYFVENILFLAEHITNLMPRSKDDIKLNLKLCSSTVIITTQMILLSLNSTIVLMQGILTMYSKGKRLEMDWNVNDSEDARRFSLSCSIMIQMSSCVVQV